MEIRIKKFISFFLITLIGFTGIGSDYFLESCQEIGTEKTKIVSYSDLIPEFEKENFDLIEDKFPRIAYNLNIVINFDWNNWNEGNEFFQNPDFNMLNYSFTDLCKLITIFIRYDRFHEGFLYSQICKGNVLKVIQRMRDLM